MTPTQKKTILIAVIVFLFIAGFIFMALRVADTQQLVSLSGLAIEQAEDGAETLIAQLSHSGDEPLHLVHMEVVLMNPNGSIASKSLVSRQDFKSGDRWEVRVAVPPGAIKYRLAKLTCQQQPDSSKLEILNACELRKVGKLDSLRS